MKQQIKRFALIALLMLTGCAQQKSFDYSAFRASKPKSILVLPPVNLSPDIKATHSILSTATLPLAEAGYYVLPVAVVEETFAQNGLTNANDIRTVSAQHLHKVFGADAVLYLDVKEYGTSYRIVDSETRVVVSANLVDLRSGKQLWSGSASASSSENSGSNNSSILGILLGAAVSQIANTISDKGFDIGAVANSRLLSATGKNGDILYGPRSPKYTD